MSSYVDLTLEGKWRIPILLIEQLLSSVNVAGFCLEYTIIISLWLVIEYINIEYTVS